MLAILKYTTFNDWACGAMVLAFLTGVAFPEVVTGYTVLAYRAVRAMVG